MPSTESILPDWARAYGQPVASGQIKHAPADFKVEELPGFETSGDGEHDFLLIEKTGANTGWVARALSRHAEVPVKDVGYAGMKDRHAVTRQWFSVRRPNATGTDWDGFSLDGVRIIEISRHSRKLRRGAHAGNRFSLVVRQFHGDKAALTECLDTIRAGGVPNYFGPQRFGNYGANMALVDSLISGSRLKRDQRGIALSAARSFLFNQALSCRVAGGSWNAITDGEAVNLDGTQSYFRADALDEELLQRSRAMDVHPTCALWGRGNLDCSGVSAEIDQAVADRHPDMAKLLERFDLSQDRRATRLAPSNLEWEVDKETLQISFCLRRGGYATSVLREILNG